MIDEMISEIKKKREFSQLSDVDIKLAYANFSKRQIDYAEKIKLTKELLRKNFSAFVSKKLLSLKNKDAEWILRKHISTRERLNNYKEIYKRIFGKEKKFSVIDLGSGINGFSYNFFNELDLEINYTSVESVGQLVNLMNYYFKKNKFSAKSIHCSLFETDKIRKIILGEKKPKIIFLFKVIDALENLNPNYSKELIKEIVSLSDKIVLSFPTRSLGNRKNFKANRKWIVDFIRENFEILDDFEISGERYIIFRN